VGYDIGQYWASTETYTPGNSGRDWIVVHYTATNASAYNNCVYFAGGCRNASAHYFVDSDSIWQSVPEGDSAWHAGNWSINSTSIGIEVVSAGQDFTEGEIQRLTWLVGELMRRYGIDADHVIRHYDVADVAPWGGTLDPHKRCPAPYVDQGKWNWLHARITSGQEDDVTPQDKEDIKNMVRDELCAVLPDLIATAVVWKHFNVDGVDGWTVGGALSHVSDDIWYKDLAGVRACDRVVGTDIAANNVNNQLPRIAEAVANPADAEKIAREVQSKVNESLEKISLNVEVKE